MTTLTTILIVDDELAIRDGLKHLINWETEGFQIIGEAENGSVALEKIPALQPDIVITDLIMPKLDGIALSKVIQQQFPTIHFLVLSSYDDFSYVSQSFKNGAVDYLLKPSLTPDSLLLALNKISKKLKKNDGNATQKVNFSQLLNRYLIGYEELDAVATADFLMYPTYQLLYTNTTWYQNTDHLNNVLTDNLFEGLAIRTIPFSSGHADAGLLIAFDNGLVNIADTLRERLLSLTYIEKESFFTLSEPFTELTHLATIFNSLKHKSENQHFYFKNQLLATVTDLFALNNGDRFDTRKFLRDILNNDFLLGITRIEDYFNKMILFSVDPIYLKQQASSIFYTLLSSLEETNPNDSEISHLKNKFLNEIGRVNYLEDFSLLVLDMTEQLKKKVQFKTPHDDELLNNIVRYIQDNYASHITLAQLADVFHYNYNYLSTFFSIHFKTSFSEYLKKVQLSEAKRLLQQSDLNLSEISIACGYSDLSYFSRIFKKEFGLPPSQYRRENQL